MKERWMFEAATRWESVANEVAKHRQCGRIWMRAHQASHYGIWNQNIAAKDESGGLVHVRAGFSYVSWSSRFFLTRNVTHWRMPFLWTFSTGSRVRPFLQPQNTWCERLRWIIWQPRLSGKISVVFGSQNRLSKGRRLIERLVQCCERWESKFFVPKQKKTRFSTVFSVINIFFSNLSAFFTAKLESLAQ